MKGFVRGVFGSSSAASQPLKITEAPAAIHYTLSSFRWHLDTRSPAKIIAVHDYLSSSASWQQAMHECIGDFPLSRLSPTVPMEVYSVDLRGHNFSEGINTPTGDNYALASAADVVRVQRDIVKGEACLTGVGFGALVACQAALHSPNAFTSLALFVKNFSQLESLCPSDYTIREAIRDAQGLDSLAAINEKLQTVLPDPIERSVLLASVKEGKGKPHFRFSDELLQMNQEVSAQSQDEVSPFAKPVVVFVCGGSAPSAEETSRFRQAFPEAKFMQMNTQGKPMMSPDVPVASMMLQSFQLLGEMQNEEESA